MHERATLTMARQLQSATALADLVEIARKPLHGGRAATHDPLVRQRLAQAWIESAAIRYTAYRNLTRLVRGGVPGPEGSVEKLFWSEMYQRMLESALAVLGPYSQLWKGDERAPGDGTWPWLYLYSRGRTIAAGTSEIQRNIIAERVLGLPRGR
jgi:alkylation response protein AidB-like acyl-CoA dehydrogenase